MSRRMKIALGLALCIVAGCSISVQWPPPTQVNNQAYNQVPADTRQGILHARFDAAGQSPLAGTWSWEGNWPAFSQSRSRMLMVSLKTETTTWSMGRDVESDSVSGLSDAPEGAPLSFTVTRAGGRMIFTGTQERKKASGEVKFESDAEAALEISKITSAEPTVEQLLKLFASGADMETMRAIGKCGLAKNVDELVRLSLSGVTADYIESLGEARMGLSADEIMRLRNSGVSADFVRRMRRPASPQPSEPNQPPPAAPRSYTVDEIVRLNMQGVTAEYVEAFEKAGYSLSGDELAKLHMQGVSARYVGEMAEAGCRFTPDEIRKLAMSGVSADYVARLKKAGYNFSADDIRKLRTRGVPADYAEQCAVPGAAPLTADELTTLRMRGVPADLVRKLRKQ